MDLDIVEKKRGPVVKTDGASRGYKVVSAYLES